jgi:hypothetical protein
LKLKGSLSLKEGEGRVRVDPLRVEIFGDREAALAWLNDTQ